MTRREAREQALCLVFEKQFQAEPIPEIIMLAREARELNPDPFAEELAAGVFEHLEEIDETIRKYSIGWSMERLSRVVLSLLRIAIFEMIYIEDVPVSVTINEAVELAKTYGGDGDAPFVNGILGSLAREKPEKAEPEKKPKKKHEKKPNPAVKDGADV